MPDPHRQILIKKEKQAEAVVIKDSQGERSQLVKWVHPPGFLPGNWRIRAKRMSMGSEKGLRLKREAKQLKFRETFRRIVIRLKIPISCPLAQSQLFPLTFRQLPVAHLLLLNESFLTYWQIYTKILHSWFLIGCLPTIPSPHSTSSSNSFLESFKVNHTFTPKAFYTALALRTLDRPNT